MATMILARNEEWVNGVVVGVFTVSIDGPLLAGSARVVEYPDSVTLENTTSKAGAIIVRNRNSGAQVGGDFILAAGSPASTLDLTSSPVNQRRNFVIDTRYPAS
jgi:hypothetical protein